MTNLKARCFAAYFGSECQRYLVDHNVPSGKDDIIELDENNFYNLVNGNGIWYYKLLLKPLSSISDEDAIEVAKMADNDIEDGFIPNEKERKTFIDSLLDSIDIGILPHHIADYLRSRSYLLPFLGHDLLKENIAIIKTEI